MQDFRNAMEVPAQWVRERLGFVVVKKAGKIPPALIVAQFDQSCAYFGTEQHPSQDQDGYEVGFAMSRPCECGEEACLQQHRFPAEGVEGLADIDDGKVQQPKNKPGPGTEPKRSGF